MRFLLFSPRGTQDCKGSVYCRDILLMCFWVRSLFSLRICAWTENTECSFFSFLSWRQQAIESELYQSQMLCPWLPQLQGQFSLQSGYSCQVLKMPVKHFSQCSLTKGSLPRSADRFKLFRSVYELTGSYLPLVQMRYISEVQCTRCRLQP